MSRDQPPYPIIRIYLHAQDKQRRQDTQLAAYYDEINKPLVKLIGLCKDVFSTHTTLPSEDYFKSKLTDCLTSLNELITITNRYLEYQESENENQKLLEEYKLAFGKGVTTTNNSFNNYYTELFRSRRAYVNYTIKDLWMGYHPLISKVVGSCNGLVFTQISLDLSPITSQDPFSHYVEWLTRVDDFQENQSLEKTYSDRNIFIKRLGFQKYFHTMEILFDELIKQAKLNIGYFILIIYETHIQAFKINEDRSFEFIESNMMHLKSKPHSSENELDKSLKHSFLVLSCNEKPIIRKQIEDRYDTFQLRVAKPLSEAEKPTFKGKLRSLVMGKKYTAVPSLKAKIREYGTLIMLSIIVSVITVLLLNPLGWFALIGFGITLMGMAAYTCFNLGVLGRAYNFIQRCTHKIKKFFSPQSVEADITIELRSTNSDSSQPSVITQDSVIRAAPPPSTQSHDRKPVEVKPSQAGMFATPAGKNNTFPHSAELPSQFCP